MSSAHPALDGEAVSNPTNRHGHPTPASVSASVTGSRGSSSPGPWRPASLAGRSSPAFGHSSTFRDTTDNPPGIHSGMTPLRGNGSTSFPEKQRTQPVTSSGSSNYGTSSPGSAWTSPSKKSASLSSGAAPTSTLSSSAERSNGNGNEQYFTSTVSTASPAHSSLNSFARSSSAASAPMASSSAALSVPTIVADSSSNSSAGMPSGPSQKQPLNMEALAAKFADSKETKEKFAKLQLSPALSPIGLTDKERRAPMGSFATPSSSSPHFAHIKVQRTASLNQGSQNSLLPRGPGSRLQPGHLAQSTDMRRTASHNNAFSSGLGMPIGANGGGFEHSNLGSGISTNNGHNSSTADGIKPMWEDPANANGGRWIVTLLNKNPELLDRCWIELAYALVGEQLDAGDDICGADYNGFEIFWATQKLYNTRVDQKGTCSGHAANEYGAANFRSEYDA
ncbi:hypothetical protein BGZ80_007360 [Entomortierella chlamydospora]|uniref:Uncharacterized protein n=1 Tax=Entomortierella chlamydospora TaxID=101097 RepID=A0A9P6T1M7_9FUNG|nr:hypothetical protein BGZ80_007360 [Entomortierella chlamydospora]